MLLNLFYVCFSMLILSFQLTIFRYFYLFNSKFWCFIFLIKVELPKCTTITKITDGSPPVCKRKSNLWRPRLTLRERVKEACCLIFYMNLLILFILLFFLVVAVVISIPTLLVFLKDLLVSHVVLRLLGMSSKMLFLLTLSGELEIFNQLVVKVIASLYMLIMWLHLFMWR